MLVTWTSVQAWRVAMQALAKRLGVKLELKPVTSSTRIPMTDSNMHNFV